MIDCIKSFLWRYNVYRRGKLTGKFSFGPIGEHKRIIDDRIEKLYNGNQRCTLNNKVFHFREIELEAQGEEHEEDDWRSGGRFRQEQREEAFQDPPELHPARSRLRRRGSRSE